MQIDQLIPEYVKERVIKKRGRIRVFEEFKASETALVVVDMQEFYVKDVPSAVAIVPKINNLAQIFRDKGAKVAWVKMVAGKDGESLWPLYHDYFFTKENADRHRDNLTEGDGGQEIFHQLVVKQDDIIANKYRFSAFIEKYSDLPKLLESNNIKNIVITGMLTNFCCETSARDAMMLDYKVVMLTDANAARFDDDHKVGFQTVFQSFGDVMDSDEFLRSYFKD